MSDATYDSAHLRSAMDFSTAWINGRSLTKSLQATKARHSFSGFSPTDRVKIQLPRDVYALGIELVHPVPFVIEDNLLVTAHDIDSPSTIVDFANMRFTENALRSAANDLLSDRFTNDLESLGSRFSGDPQQALEFSKLVCAWGGGQRVWGNLNRHYSEEQLEAELGEWLLAAKDHKSARLAISRGVDIKGLGVSFASKHLRHLDPNRFAVLDDVISQGLGYALNPAGYTLFISDLRRLQQSHFPEFRVADIEAGLFVLIRQIVRGRTAG